MTLSALFYMDYQYIIDKYYPKSTPLREIFLRHSRSVADLALEIASDCALPLSPVDIEAAAMLHDIGIFLTDAPDIHCHGTEHYLRHGVLGAELLRREGVAEDIARVAERHTGAGITAVDIVDQHLPLPVGDYLPKTLLERLICYADKFYSKNGDMQRKPLDRVRKSLQRFGDASLARFDSLHAQFSTR